MLLEWLGRLVALNEAVKVAHIDTPSSALPGVNEGKQAIMYKLAHFPSAEAEVFSGFADAQEIAS